MMTLPFSKATWFTLPSLYLPHPTHKNKHTLYKGQYTFEQRNTTTVPLNAI